MSKLLCSAFSIINYSRYNQTRMEINYSPMSYSFMHPFSSSFALEYKIRITNTKTYMSVDERNLIYYMGKRIVDVLSPHVTLP